MKSIRDYIAKNERDFDTLPPQQDEMVGLEAESAEVSLDGEPIVQETTIRPLEKRALESFFVDQKGKASLKDVNIRAKQQLEQGENPDFSEIEAEIDLIEDEEVLDGDYA